MKGGTSTPAATSSLRIKMEMMTMDSEIARSVRRVVSWGGAGGSALGVLGAGAAAAMSGCVTGASAGAATMGAAGDTGVVACCALTASATCLGVSH